MKAHKANSHGASVGNGGLADQMAARKRSDGSTAGGEAIAGTSIFDPVLAELLIRWFSPPQAYVLDPFAGGSVRGIVSGMLGRHYEGIDLSRAQVEANREQARLILPEDAEVDWRVGDSAVVLHERLEVTSGFYDFILTCPPYADLEVYSTDPADISNMPYHEFRRAFDHIMGLACQLLAEDRFATIVIGDARDKKTGELYGLPSHTVEMMQRHGLKLWNHAILLTPAGSAPTRARNGFVRGRKLCSTHQHVLVFLKGDGKRAVEACGECDFGAMDPLRFGESEAAESVAAALGLGTGES